MSNFGFLGYPSTCAFGTTSSAPSSVSTLLPFGGSEHHSANQSGLGFCWNATQATLSGLKAAFSPISSPLNANSPFPSVHSNPFSVQTQSGGVTTTSPFSTKSNANSVFPSANSNPSFSFSPVNRNSVFTQTQSNSVSGFAQLSSHSNRNSPFPSVHSDPFSALTQNSGVTTAFSPFPSRLNASSPFSLVHSNPFSTQTQSSGGVTNTSPFSTESNANSVFPSTNSNPSSSFFPVNRNSVSTQTQSNSASGFAPFSSQSNANSYPFTPQTPSFNSQVNGGFSTNNTSSPFSNSTTKPVIFPSPGSRYAPYASTEEPEGNFHSISSMPVYQTKSHEELRFEDLCTKDGQNAIKQAVFPTLKPSFVFPAVVSAPINSCTKFPGFISPANTQAMPSNPTLLQENIFAPKSSSSASDFPNSSNIAPPLSSFIPNCSLSPGSTLCSNCKHVETQPALVAPSTNLSPNQLNPSSVQQTVQGLEKDVDSTPQNQSSVGPEVQVSFNSHPGSVISVQYGISSLSVSDKASPTRRRSLLIVRHSSLNRQNPRSWIRPLIQEFPQSYNSNTLPEMEHTSIIVYENDAGNVTQADPAKEKQTDTCEAVNYKHDINVDEIMPKLKNDEYYTEPTIQELAEKEREEPGFCRRVKDFVIGRRGFGAIKFTGETDVVGLELDAIIQFNSNEVIVYMDDSKKPEVGKGLNKAAEITFLNLKCINKKTGEEYKDGYLVDRYKNLLITKCAEQGAEFVSYDPVKGEWKLKVKHFSNIVY